MCIFEMQFTSSMISHVNMVHIIELVLDLQLDVLMASITCNRSFNMLKIVLQSLDNSANSHLIFKRFSPSVSEFNNLAVDSLCNIYVTIISSCHRK